ncbi:MAG: thiopurine S-methyltransferase [Leptospiraceae bacterium]|nr:thiopurine S-methyltransferase [Leptospiraceae bacterium]
MEESFWHRKWEVKEIGFHRNEVNPLLIKFIDELKLNSGDRVLVPLCGKTLDIEWLLSKGFSVVGVELSVIAIEELFLQLGLKPKIEDLGSLKLYSSENINIYVGNIFSLTKEILGKVSAIYDRAALVALPEELRIKYTKHLLEITNFVPELLICYEHNSLSGPPFSISFDEVQLHFQEKFSISELQRTNLGTELKSDRDSFETVWLLNPK